MIKTVKKLIADKNDYRVNVRYQGQPQWFPCTILDADDVGIVVEAEGETIAIPWSGLAALSFKEVEG